MPANTIRGTIRGMAERANPAFAVGVVAVSVLALAYAVTVASLRVHTYIHVLFGLLWTGTDVFMGAVLGPVTGGLDEEESAAVFQRLTPKTSFFLPALALATIGSGLPLADRLGFFATPEPWFALFTAANLLPALAIIGWRLDGFGDRRWQLAFALAAVGSLTWVALTIGSLAMPGPAILAALVIVTILSVVGFGYLLPGEIKMYREMISEAPDPGIISAIGQQNAKLGGVQGVFQLVLVAVMVSLRYGGF